MSPYLVDTNVWLALAVGDHPQHRRASTKVWTDVHLAAFAVAGGCTLVSSDAGFRQFPELDLLLL